MVHSALRAVFKYNWRPDLTGWRRGPRAFAGERDKGLIICTWPKGGRPASVMLYWDEVWTGIEYQVAAHLIYEGMLAEGFAVVKGARDRYDGVPRAPLGRNPWNEIECGGHYARAMSSWALLLALTGWEYDGPSGAQRFTPRCQPDNLKAFFCGPEGWGSLRQTRDAQGQTSEITVAEGALVLRQVVPAPLAAPKAVAVRVGQRQLGASCTPLAGEALLVPESPLRLSAGETMSMRLG